MAAGDRATREAANHRATRLTRTRYNRISPLYDLMDRWFPNDRRKDIAGRARGDVLEIGVGTGHNLAFYPPGCRVTGIDLSPAMLGRASRRAAVAPVPVTLKEMDAQDLEFDDATFDTVLATFVFCSVPDPVRGLREAGRVCRPGGQILLLEHVRSANPILGPAMDLFDPVAVRLTGAHINRRTVENVEKAGLRVRAVTNLMGRIVKFIEAGPPVPVGPPAQ